MQTAIYISNLILCTIGFLCIYLKIDTKQKSILKERSKRKVTKLRKYFITGDKHREFKSVKKFCRDMKTEKEDVLIILGDAGLNYYGDKRDIKLKKQINALNITLFCIHGNKENRPQNVGTYGIRNFCGGKVYYEPKYPNIYFGIDGEVYTFEDRKYMVVGGAHSVDKIRCLQEGRPFWHDEMPDDTVRRRQGDGSPVSFFH